MIGLFNKSHVLDSQETIDEIEFNNYANNVYSPLPYDPISALSGLS